MYSTPRAKRRLFFTPLSSGKRSRFQASSSAQSKATGRFALVNRRTTSGPKRTGSLTAQVRSLQRVVKNLCPEQKYADISFTASNIATTGYVAHLTAIAQGDTQSTRTGNTIDVTSVSVRGSFSAAADIALVSYMRIAIVVDKQQIADTTPNVSDVFTSDPVIALPTLANLERFRVLHLSPVYDVRRMSLDTDNVGPPTQSAYFDYTWKGNIKVSYNGTAATDQNKNNIYFLILSDVSAATLDFGGYARIGFTDV